MAYMPIKIYKDKVEITGQLNASTGNITNLASSTGSIEALTVGGTANIGNKIILEIAENGNAALSVVADNITVGNNITIGSDGNITANSFIGKSLNDGKGRNIAETYATKEELSNEVGTLSTNIDGVSTALSNYKTEVNNTYALKTDVPSLSGYATEVFVDNKLASYVPTDRTINGKALTENVILGAGDITSGVLKVKNGGTGVSSLYKEGAVTPASGTITSTSYVREYTFLKLVVFSIKLENASFSKG